MCILIATCTGIIFLLFVEFVDKGNALRVVKVSLYNFGLGECLVLRTVGMSGADIHSPHIICVLRE